MNIDIDELLGDLPRVEASSAFKQDLMDQIPHHISGPSQGNAFSKLTPIVMAASLACGLFLGLADMDMLNTALGGLGLAVDETTIAGEWASSVSPYASTFDVL